MKKFIKKTLIFFLSVIVFSSIYGFTIDVIYKNGSYFRSQWIHSLNDKNLDVVIIGNSRASLQSLESEKINYLNLGEDGIGMGLTYLQIYSFYKNGNKTDNVLLQGDYLSFNKDDDSRRSPRWLPYFNDPIIYDILKNGHTTFKYHNYLPAINYTIFKFDWGFSSLINNLFKLKESPWGFFGYYNVCNEYINKGPEGSVDFNKYKQNTYWIDEINKLCKDNDSKLIIYTAPYLKMKDSISDVKLFKEELAKKDIIYLNFSRQFELNKSNFRDNNHLNCFGVNAFSEILTKKLLTIENNNSY